MSQQAATVAAPRAPLDVEKLRVPTETRLAAELRQVPELHALEQQLAERSATMVRRQLMGRALRLTRTMAPDTLSIAEGVAETLRVKEPLEIYQSSGAENAAIHLVESPILLEIQGRLLGLLDPMSMKVVFGHELGHFMAHGPWGPNGRLGVVARAILEAENAPPRYAAMASAFSMACELTADRFGLLATADLSAVLRLEMISTTGLSGDMLTWDTEAYLEQCRELMQASLQGDGGVQGITHPEHSLRAWAAWLFSESDLFKSLTGVGPGTRSIDDINTLIGDALRQPPSFEVFDPPQELHELALACSVLVAAVDGQISDGEAQTIERTFCSLVPDWRSYLDPRVAVVRFSELANVVVSLGASVQRALFGLLSHVMLADGVVDSREVAMIRQIGSALECRPLFESLLGPLLRRFRVEGNDDQAQAIFTPKRSEAEAALDAFLKNMTRRGGGATTLRRLLRILGTKERSEPSLLTIDRGLSKHKLTTAANLKAVMLDEPFQLQAVGASENLPSINVADRPALVRALGRLRDELISGDGRSPSVRLRTLRAGRAFDLASLDAFSLGKSERVVTQLTSPEPTRVEIVSGEEVGRSPEAHKASRELIELRREHVARVEEAGARELYLGTPFVCGVVGGYLVRDLWCFILCLSSEALSVPLR